MYKFKIQFLLSKINHFKTPCLCRCNLTSVIRRDANILLSLVWAQIIRMHGRTYEALMHIYRHSARLLRYNSPMQLYLNGPSSRRKYFFSKTKDLIIHVTPYVNPPFLAVSSSVCLLLMVM